MHVYTDHEIHFNNVVVFFYAIGRGGRPRIEISDSQLQLLFNQGFSAPKMAEIIGCSTRLIHKHLKRCHLSLSSRYATLSPAELDRLVNEIVATRPRSGITV
jgi:hypothetical protein